MIVLTVDKVQLAQLKRKLQMLSPKSSDSIMKRAFVTLAVDVQHKLVDNVSGKILHVRTGNLRRSIQVRMFETSNTYGALIGSGVLTGKRVVYANIHETGGTIYPKKGQFLYFQVQNSSRIATMRGGYQMLKNPRAESTWVRARVVRIPARRYMSRTIEEMQPKTMTILKQSIEDQLRRVS